MNTRTILPVLVLALGLAAALPAATLPAATPVPGFTDALPAANAAPAEGQAYTVDTLHSSVIFRVRHLDISNFYGVFQQVTGQVVLDEREPSSSSVQIEIQTDSIDTRSTKRDGHLKGPDFFNTKEFPAMTFASTVVKRIAEDRYEVSGDLQVRGVTKSITIVVDKTGEGDTSFRDHRAGFEAHFVVDLGDYRMPVVEKMSEEMLGHQVHLIVALECIRA